MRLHLAAGPTLLLLALAQRCSALGALSPFEFVSAGRIVFGSGKAEALPELVSELGRRRCLLVCGSSGPSRHGSLVSSLTDAVDALTVFQVAREPELDDVRAGVAAARECGADVVVGLGGGSVVDCAKAIAALATNDGDMMRYVEVIGDGQPLEAAPLPFVAVPTTSGTGSEVTKNAVVRSAEHGRKVSIRSAQMLPDIAVIDPLLTHSAPPALTAHTGMDALTQCIEPYCSNAANPLTDGLCREGITRAARSLRRAFEDGSDAQAREDMAVASVFGGLSLANAKLGAVHGFSGVLGGRFDGAPHGAVCACLLAAAFRVNAAAVEGDARRRHEEVAAMLTGEAGASVEDGAAWLEALTRDLGIPKLPELCKGFDPEDEAMLDDIVAESAKSSSMKGNPVPLSPEQLKDILRQSS